MTNYESVSFRRRYVNCASEEEHDQKKKNMYNENDTNV